MHGFSRVISLSDAINSILTLFNSNILVDIKRISSYDIEKYI